MSELKVYHCNEWHNEYTQFYLKSEADKVIAELKDKALQYKVLDKEHCRDLNTQERFFAKQIAYNKYKRCLAMARWCEDKIDTIKNGYMVSSINTQHGVMTTCPPECNPKFSFYSRWHKRWLGLAEKFKEVK